MELSLKKLSQALGLPPQKVERWISQGKIPVRQDGVTCTFNQSALEKWAHNHHLNFSMPDNAPLKESDAPLENLLPAMKKGGVYYDIKGESIVEVLENAVAGLECLPAHSKQTLVQRLIEREELTSTGIGKGVAIPHPRVPLEEMGETSLLSTCFLKSPIDFNSIDDKPVSILFILLSPTTKGHLHLLSRLAFCVRDDAFVSLLNTVPTTEQLFEEISKFEAQLDRTDGR